MSGPQRVGSWCFRVGSGPAIRSPWAGGRMFWIAFRGIQGQWRGDRCGDRAHRFSSPTTWKFYFDLGYSGTGNCARNWASTWCGHRRWAPIRDSFAWYVSSLDEPASTQSQPREALGVFASPRPDICPCGLLSGAIGPRTLRESVFIRVKPLLVRS